MSVFDKAVEEYIHIKSVQARPEDVIVVTVANKKASTSNIKTLVDACKKKFPNNQVLFINDFVNLECIEKSKLIELYENILDKLKNGEEENND